MRKNLFITLIGLPGSGKTTLRNKILERFSNFEVISRDILITNETNILNISYFNINKFAQLEYAIDEYYECLKMCNVGKDVIMDDMNLTKMERDISGKYYHYNYFKIAIIIERSLKEIIDVNIERGICKRGIPEDVLNIMSVSYEPPTLEEGFDLIINHNKEDIDNKKLFEAIERVLTVDDES